jgi:hypothetical protein
LRPGRVGRPKKSCLAEATQQTLELQEIGD